MDCQRIGVEHGRVEALRQGVFLEDRLDELDEDARAVADAASRRA